MNKNVKRATLVLALTPLMAVPATAALAATTTGPTTALAPVTKVVTSKVMTSTPALATSSGDTTTTTTTHTDAPPASASATAAEVEGVIAVGKTSATAGSGSGSAHAHALELGGSTVFGGDVDGTGSKSGNAIGTGDTPLGDAELFPWAAKVTSDGSGTQSVSEAALAHAGLLGVLQVWLLHSQSQATWTPDASHGHSSSDGAEVNLADQLDVKVLHAETDSDGKGSSAVLVINGTGVLTSDQTGNQCVIPADPIVHLLCLQASGGKGSNGTTTETADVLTETSGIGLPGGTISGATSAGGKVAAPATSTTGNHRKSQNGPLPHTSGPSAAKLPFTGTEAGLLAAYGALLTGLGAAITTAARRRRPSAARTA